MGKHPNAVVAVNKPGEALAASPVHELQQQCLRILRCTAQALANSPGGLRFRAGTRPWLDVLAHGCSTATLSGQQGV